MKIERVIGCSFFLSLSLLAGCAAEASSTEPSSSSESELSSDCRAVIAGKDESARFPCEAQFGTGGGGGAGGGGGGGGAGSPSQSTLHALLCTDACGNAQRGCEAGCRARYEAASTPLTKCLASCESTHAACVKSCR